MYVFNLRHVIGALVDVNAFRYFVIWFCWLLVRVVVYDGVYFGFTPFWKWKIDIFINEINFSRTMYL